MSLSGIKLGIIASGRKYSMSASLSVGLSFSVATMAKSAKMVPVMLLGGELNPGVDFTCCPKRPSESVFFF